MNNAFVKGNIFRKLVTTTLIVLVFCMISMFASGCTLPDKPQNILTPPEEKTDTPISGQNEREFVAKAIIKTVESASANSSAKIVATNYDAAKIAAEKTDVANVDTTNSDTTNNSTEEQEYAKVSYSFDYLQITKAEKFNIGFPKSIGLLEQTCGEGELEVYIGEFVAYEADGAGSDNLVAVISDKLIVFRGEKGLYSCLENGLSILQGEFGEPLDGNIAQFSSHKFFGKSSVDKDLTPPIHLFYVHRLNNVISVGYEISYTDGGWKGLPAKLYEAVVDSYQAVETAKMYSTHETL